VATAGLTAVDQLAGTPRPEGAFGGTGVLPNIPTGNYRGLYEIRDQQVRVGVVHLGRLR
jgi:mRNA interferase RelE/StbE